MNDFGVLFSRTPPTAQSVPDDTVVVWPVDPNWNDHGFGFQARARIRRAGIAQHVDCALFVVPESTEFSRFNTWLESELAGSQPGVRLPAEHHRFFTILKTEAAYRSIVQLCAADPSETGRILRPMRDIVYYRWAGLEQAHLRILLSSDRATKGLFRSYGTYLAWHRGPRILSGEPATPVEDARIEFAFKTSLEGFDGPHSARFRFDVPAPLVDRCHALIGKNGAGKSRFLRELIIDLGQRIDGSGDSAFIDGEEASGTETELSPEHFKVNRLVAMSWDGNSQFPRSSRLDSQLQYFSYGINEYRTHSEGTDLAALDASETQTSMLIQLLREEELAGRAPYERLRNILRPVLRIGDLCVYLEPNTPGSQGDWVTLNDITFANETRQLEMIGRVDMKVDPLKRNESGNVVPLSSGERTFLSFGVRGAARLIPGSLLIMDEPETHLHPTLIADFMRILAQLLLETRSIALVATHSPFVVRELPGRCVHIVDFDDERVPSINGAFLRTLGASIDQLSVDIFGDAGARQLNQELAKKIVERGIPFAQIRAEYGRDMSSDMLSEIFHSTHPTPGAAEDTDDGLDGAEPLDDE